MCSIPFEWGVELPLLVQNGARRTVARMGSSSPSSSDEQSSSDSRRTDGPPVPIRLTTALSVIEAGGLMAASCAFAVHIFGANGQQRLSAILLALMFALAGVGMAAAARAIWNGKRWGRGVITTGQLLIILVAASYVNGQWWWIALPVVLTGVTSGVAIFRPASLNWLGMEGDDGIAF